MPMKQLHLTISPEFFTRFGEYLKQEINRKEFFNRIAAVSFNDYCTFYYSPQQQSSVLETLAILDEMGLETAFLRLLDNENVEEANNKNLGGTMFQYLGFGNLPVLSKSEAAIEIYDLENVALIDFSGKKETHIIQVILDVESKLKAPKDWPVLPTFLSFLEWSIQLNPRSFDDAMNAKHASQGKKGFGSSLLCSIEEAKKVLQIAVYKNSDHENHLFFYHFPKTGFPVLWLKAAKGTFHFHGFHISEQAARLKGLDLNSLEIYSNYLKTQGF